MIISKKRHFQLYKSISNPITDLRVKFAKGNVKDLDQELFVLENRIYKEIKEALSLEILKG